MHKAGNLGRPIVSGNGSPTECICEFVDSYLNPLVSHIPSYIQDTTDFLRKLEGIKHQIPNSAFLVTLDVSSLYTNIPHGEGIMHVPSLSDPTTKPNIQWDTKNNVTFLERNFLQVQGTALFISDLDLLTIYSA